jgi:hypothetical protein
MPRPKKIAQEETNISEVVDVQEELVIELEDELVIEPVSMSVPELEVLPVIEVTPKTIYKGARICLKIVFTSKLNSF